MRIICNADEFGRDEDSVRGAIECFQSGALTSASISPVAAASEMAIEFALKHPEFSFGVQVALYLSNPPSAFEEQIERQIASVYERGVPVSHVSADAALMRMKWFLAALGRILPKFHVRRVRSGQDLYIRRPVLSPAYWMDRVARGRIRGRFLTTDHLFIPRTVAEAQAMKDWMPAMTDESLEVSVRPALLDGFGNAQRQAIQSLAARALAAGHHLITWNQL